MSGVGSEAFAAYTDDRVCTYEVVGCAVKYTVQNEWDRYRQMETSVTNNSEETLRDWAVKFDR